MPIEQREEGGRVDQLVHGHRREVVRQIQIGVLVEVVADAGAVAQQVLHRHVIGDQGEVGPENRARGAVEAEDTLVHQAHHRERREGLRPAGDGQLAVDGHRDGVGAVGEAERRRDGRRVRSIDPDNPAEVDAFGQCCERVLEPQHVVTPCRMRGSRATAATVEADRTATGCVRGRLLERSASS
jgi:hypothetical protein